MLSLFGEEVVNLVDGVTKLTKISDTTAPHQKGLSKEERQAENLRKIFLAMAKDLRVIFIKLADRLHNMRTLSSLPENKQKSISMETIEIFAPMANRLGIWHIKNELEDLAFKYLEPGVYSTLMKEVDTRRAKSNKIFKEATELLNKELIKNDIKATIESRFKHYYGIYQKMNNKEKGLEEIYDFTALRVIVPTVSNCYGVLGIIHSIWVPLPDRIKDYIATPKANGYQSLHTTVFGPSGELMELQIRTWQMHRIDEFGIAAHWQYKEGWKDDRKFQKQITPFIQQLIDWQADLKDAKEFIQSLKMDFLNSQVFVFTPGGDLLDLPANSTPIDFAYRIHTEVGNKCVGAKVNSKIVPLNYKLQNGDIVEIITSNVSSGPSRDWMNICNTSSAKNKIRNWFKKEKREENILRGKEITDREIRKLRRIWRGFSKKDLFERVMKRYPAYNSEEEFLAAIGYGDIPVVQISKILREELDNIIGKIEEKKSDPTELSEKQERIDLSYDGENFIQVKDIKNLVIRVVRCCNPLPGEDIIGYITQGRGVSVHRRICHNFKFFSRYKERLIEVNWSLKKQKNVYPVQLLINGWDRPGMLNDLTSLLKDELINSRSISAYTERMGEAVVKIVIDVKDIQQLNNLIKKIKNINGITQVKRIVQEKKS
ncbi:MAG: GTP pyrophosphokinase [bacterium ADurb.Bin363]|nr:MAG: GTP pyrophosphokinase [bacterium ADurb.Bin363]